MCDECASACKKKVCMLYLKFNPHTTSLFAYKHTNNGVKLVSDHCFMIMHSLRIMISHENTIFLGHKYDTMVRYDTMEPMLLFISCTHSNHPKKCEQIAMNAQRKDKTTNETKIYNIISSLA